MSGQYLTPQQVAKRMNVQAVKVRAWIVSGRLKAINVSAGKRAEYRVLESALAEFEESLLVVKPVVRTVANRKSRSAKTPDYFKEFQ